MKLGTLYGPERHILSHFILPVLINNSMPWLINCNGSAQFPGFVATLFVPRSERITASPRNFNYSLQIKITCSVFTRHTMKLYMGYTTAMSEKKEDKAIHTALNQNKSNKTTAS